MPSAYFSCQALAVQGHSEPSNKPAPLHQLDKEPKLKP